MFRSNAIWIVLTAVLAILPGFFGQTAAATEQSPCLMLVDAQNPEAVEILAAAGSVINSRWDHRILATVGPVPAAALKGAGGRILDCTDLTAGTWYYWVMRPGGFEAKSSTGSGDGRSAAGLHELANPGIDLLFRDDRVAVIRATPADVEQLPMAGYEIVRIPGNTQPLQIPARAGTASPPAAEGQSDTAKEGPITPANTDQGVPAPLAFGGLIDTMVAGINQPEYTVTIQTLEDFGTRYTPTAGIDNAADWIFDTFEGFGLEVERHYFAYGGGDKQNIVATIPGLVSPEEVVFITGHYDCTSQDPYNSAPGADDNASGTSAVIEAARVLSRFGFEKTIKFACFAGEEQGLLGSWAYVEDIYNAGMDVVGCYNFDMIAWSGSDPAPPDLIIYTDSASTAIANRLRDAALYYAPEDLQPVVLHEELSASDHASFWWHGYPAIVGIEAEAWSADFNPYYHSTDDTVAHCDLEYATNVTRAAVAAVADAAVPVVLGSPYIVTGAGPSYDNAPLVRVFAPLGGGTPEYEFSAYGSPHYGVKVAAGDLDGDGRWEILTGAGPGQIYGPHVRGFEMDGTPLAGLSYMAYGTHKYGVNVTSADLDGDGLAEILTGAGPGTVFGPHVRAFQYDAAGASITPLPGVSYLAYGTNRWGVNVAGGDIDGDGMDEIVTGAGPGAVFGAHVRGWNVDGGQSVAIPAVSFLSYSTRRYGVEVGCGDVDGDGIDEIVTAPGPSAAFGAHVRGWNFDGAAVEPLTGFSMMAWPESESRHGARIWAGADLDGDGRDELVVGAGPDPAVGTEIKVFKYDGATLSQWDALAAYPDGWTHGAAVAAGWF